MSADIRILAETLSKLGSKLSIMNDEIDIKIYFKFTIN